MELGIRILVGKVFCFMLPPVSVHPSVDLLFSYCCEMYMCHPIKIVQVLKQSMYRLKTSFIWCLKGVERQWLLEGLLV